MNTFAIMGGARTTGVWRENFATESCVRFPLKPPPSAYLRVDIIPDYPLYVICTQ